MQESRRDYQPTSHDEQTMATRPIIPASAHHTPGPWRANGDVVTGNDVAGMAVVAMPNLGPYMLTYDRRVANARLIAAAPDLLAALEAAYALILDGQEDIYPDDSTAGIARAAIAKARGQ